MWECESQYFIWLEFCRFIYDVWVCVCMIEKINDQFKCVLLFHWDLFAQLWYSFDWKWAGSNRITFFSSLCLIQKINGAHKTLCTCQRESLIIKIVWNANAHTLKLSITLVKLVGIIAVKCDSLMMLIHKNLLLLWY